MINKIKWTKDKEKLIGLQEYIIQEINETFDEIEIDLDKNNIIYSESGGEVKNTFGKTIIFHSLQYVLGEHKDSKHDSLIKIVNSKHDLFKSEEFLKKKFLFFHDIEIFFSNKGSQFKLKRILKKIEKNEIKFQAVDSWELTDITNGKTTYHKRDSYLKHVLPLIFSFWPSDYGYNNLSFKKEKIENIQVPKKLNVSVHEYNQFLYKKQFQFSDKTSSPSFFSEYAFWGSIKYQSILYSIFSNKLDENLKSEKLIADAEIFNNENKEINEKKIKLKILKNEKRKFESKTQLNDINKESIVKIKRLIKKIDDLANKLKPHLNDVFSNEDKLKITSNSILYNFKMDSPDYYFDIEAKILLESYFSCVSELKKERDKNKVNSSIDIMFYQLLESAYSEIDELNEEINKHFFSIDVELHKKNAKILNSFFNDFKDVLIPTLGETGAELNIVESEAFVNLIEKSDKKFPYLFVDDYLNSINEIAKIEEITNLYYEKIISKKIFDQVILTTAISNKSTFEKMDNVRFIVLDSLFFKSDCKNQYIKQINNV